MEVRSLPIGERTLDLPSRRIDNEDFYVVGSAYFAWTVRRNDEPANRDHVHCHSLRRFGLRSIPIMNDVQRVDVAA